MNKNDLRYQKTETLIKDAFFKQITAKEIKDIRVKDLCDKAQISRKTFYDHYEDIYDLAQKLCAIRFNLDTTSANHSLHDILTKMFGSLKESIFSNIPITEIRPEGVRYVFSNQNQIIYDYLIEKGFTPKYSHHDQVKYILSYISSGTSGAYESWFHSRNRMSFESFWDFMRPTVIQSISELFV